MKKVKKFIHLFKERIIGFWLIDDINVGDIDVGDEFQDVLVTDLKNDTNI